MSQDTVLNAWMVTINGTINLKRKIVQKEGFIKEEKESAGMLCLYWVTKLELITTRAGLKTMAHFDWDEFNSEKKLSEIPIVITTSETEDNSGTKLIITNEYGNVLADEISEIDSEKS